MQVKDHQRDDKASLVPKLNFNSIQMSHYSTAREVGKHSNRYGIANLASDLYGDVENSNDNEKMSSLYSSTGTGWLGSSRAGCNQKKGLQRSKHDESSNCLSSSTGGIGMNQADCSVYSVCQSGRLNRALDGSNGHLHFLHETSNEVGPEDIANSSAFEIINEDDEISNELSINFINQTHMKTTS